MPTEEFKLPNGERVRLVYGDAYPNTPTLYLQGIRSGSVSEDRNVALMYHAMERIYACRLADAVLAEVGHVDAILTPPSSRADAEPYRDAISMRLQARDLTDRFDRKGIVRASEAASLDDLVAEFIYEPDGDEGDIKTLLIIDESIASGKTVASLLTHLRLSGLSIDCRVMVAVQALLRE